jgi:hypothetical protein
MLTKLDEKKGTVMVHYGPHDSMPCSLSIITDVKLPTHTSPLSHLERVHPFRNNNFTNAI